MNIITVRKANVVLTVPEEQREEYLAKGFDVVDSKTFKVIDKAIPKDANALWVMVKELQDKIKALTEENNKLKAELSSKEPELPDEPDFSKVTDEQEDTSEEVEPEEPEEVEAFTPINKRNSKKTTKK